MKKALFFLTTLVVAGFLFQSCKKDTDFSADRMTAEDIVATNDLTEQIDYDADVAVDAFTGTEVDDRGDCPSVTFAQPKGTWPNTITLDYSDAGCTKDGRTFKGKIIITQSAAMNTQGAVRSFAFDNFYVNDVKIEGSKTVTNAGLDAGGNLYFSVSASETLIFPDGTVATHSTARVRTLIEGGATPTRTDNVWSITGGGTGTNRNGVAYTVTITTPLVKSAICPWISEGVVEFTLNNKTRSLDFGDGTCDRDATLTLANGNERNVKIRHHWWR